MSNISKEQKLFAQGMEHALRVVQGGGIEALEKEVRYRQQYPLPPFVTVGKLHNEARKMIEPELEIIGVANLVTLVDDLKLPNMSLQVFLEGYNRRCDDYRLDPELMERDSQRMGKNFSIRKMTLDFLNEK